MAARTKETAAPGVMQGSGGHKRCLAARNFEHSENVIDFQSRAGVDAYRRRWLRRRVPMSSELAAMIVSMAFEGGTR